MRAPEDLTQPAAWSPREAAPLWTVLAVVGAVSWVLTVGQARTMGAGPGTMGMAFLFFVAMWVAMMAAMMLPAIGPMAVGRLSEGRALQSTGVPGVLVLAGGFLAPWAAYGIAAFAALVGTGRLVESSPGLARWLGVAIFAVAGLYQLSSWKLRALHHCRARMTSVRRAGLAGSFVTGVRDGAICVGCCWALMTILIAVGVMNVAAMAGLAVVIFGEKILPRPRLIAGLAGVAFLGFAAAAVIEPSLLSGLTDPGMGAHMGGMDMGGM